MGQIRVRFSDVAVADILEQADWYDMQSGRELARRWESAVTDAVLRIAENPLSGAVCAFKSPELQDVRRKPIKGFLKHLVLYRFDEDGLSVLRVIHGASDLDRLF